MNSDKAELKREVGARAIMIAMLNEGRPSDMPLARILWDAGVRAIKAAERRRKNGGRK